MFGKKLKEGRDYTVRWNSEIWPSDPRTDPFPVDLVEIHGTKEYPFTVYASGDNFEQVLSEFKEKYKERNPGIVDRVLKLLR